VSIGAPGVALGDVNATPVAAVAYARVTDPFVLIPGQEEDSSLVLWYHVRKR
jgi:hypothetical protein